MQSHEAQTTKTQRPVNSIIFAVLQAETTKPKDAAWGFTFWNKKISGLDKSLLGLMYMPSKKQARRMISQGSATQQEPLASTTSYTRTFDRLPCSMKPPPHSCPQQRITPECLPCPESRPPREPEEQAAHSQAGATGCTPASSMRRRWLWPPFLRSKDLPWPQLCCTSSLCLWTLTCWHLIS